jgi:hypothetical protein
VARPAIRAAGPRAACTIAIGVNLDTSIHDGAMTEGWNMCQLRPLSPSTSSTSTAPARPSHRTTSPTLDLCSAAAPYEFRFSGHAHGPLTVGDAWYTSGMNIGIEEVGSVYINIATGGTLLARHRSQVVQVDLRRGVVFQATGMSR